MPTRGLRHNRLAKEPPRSPLKSLCNEGLSLQTVNHHRTAIRAFSKWCWKSGRTRTDCLAGVTGFNAKEDRRHDRRTLGVDELRVLIEAAHSGPPWRRTGPTRALCYRLAVGTGLRYSEIESITRESFDWTATPATVMVAAGYTKNGEPATLPLPSDLALDLHTYVASLPLEGRSSLLPRTVERRCFAPTWNGRESPTLTLAVWCSTSTPCVVSVRRWLIKPE